MTLANDLSQSLLHKIQDHFSLEEVCGEGGGPYLPLPCPIPGVPAGQCRVFKGEKVPLMVYVGAGLPMASLDSHMIFAFTKADSLDPGNYRILKRLAESKIEQGKYAEADPILDKIASMWIPIAP